MLVIICSTLCLIFRVEKTWSKIILPVINAIISESIGKRYWLNKATPLPACLREYSFLSSIALIIVGKIAVIDAEP